MSLNYLLSTEVTKNYGEPL